MDEADRAELLRMQADMATLAALALRGIVAICGELSAKGLFGTVELGRVSEFMLAGLEQGDASPELQAELHEQISRHFSALVWDAWREDT